MSLNYRLVRRPDMRKDAAEGSKLYYAQVRSLKKLKFEKFCNMVAVRSSAFVGDVKLVIDGILSVMEERLEEGDVIQLGRLGNFRMAVKSPGYSPYRASRFKWSSSSFFMQYPTSLWAVTTSSGFCRGHMA